MTFGNKSHYLHLELILKIKFSKNLLLYDETQNFFWSAFTCVMSTTYSRKNGLMGKYSMYFYYNSSVLYFKPLKFLSEIFEGTIFPQNFKQCAFHTSFYPCKYEIKELRSTVLIRNLMLFLKNFVIVFLLRVSIYIS